MYDCAAVVSQYNNVLAGSRQFVDVLTSDSSLQSLQTRTNSKPLRTSVVSLCGLCWKF